MIWSLVTHVLEGVVFTPSEVDQCSQPKFGSDAETRDSTVTRRCGQIHCSHNEVLCRELGGLSQHHQECLTRTEKNGRLGILCWLQGRDGVRTTTRWPGLPSFKSHAGARGERTWVSSPSFPNVGQRGKERGGMGLKSCQQSNIKKWSQPLY